MADLSDPTFWIPTAISIVAVLLFYLDMRGRIKREEKASTEMAQMMKVLKDELDLFRSQRQAGKVTSQDIAKQEQIDATWKNILSALKAAKLFKEVFGDDE
jgi:ATP-dependent Zn protease